MENLSNEQAKEILNHLINEFERNGYSYIVQDILKSWNEDDEVENMSYTSSRSLLSYFIDESIALLGQHSNDNYPFLIERFNKLLNRKGNPIASIFVEIEGQEKESFDLKSLPDYSELIEDLIQLKKELYSYN